MIARIFTYYILSSVSFFFFLSQGVVFNHFYFLYLFFQDPSAGNKTVRFSSSENVLVSPVIPKGYFCWV